MSRNKCATASITNPTSLRLRGAYLHQQWTYPLNHWERNSVEWISNRQVQIIEREAQKNAQTHRNLAEGCAYSLSIIPSSTVHAISLFSSSVAVHRNGSIECRYWIMASRYGNKCQRIMKVWVQYEHNRKIVISSTIHGISLPYFTPPSSISYIWKWSHRKVPYSLRILRYWPCNTPPSRASKM